MSSGLPQYQVYMKAYNTVLLHKCMWFCFPHTHRLMDVIDTVAVHEYILKKVEQSHGPEVLRLHSLLLWLEHVLSLLVLPTVNALATHFVSRPTNMPFRCHDHILYGTHGSCPASASGEQVWVIHHTLPHDSIFKGRSKTETSTTECQTGTIWCLLTLPVPRRVHKWGCWEETLVWRLGFGEELCPGGWG